MAATAEKDQSLSGALVAAISPDRKLSNKRKKWISGFSREVGKHPVDFIAIAKDLTSRSFRLHIYLGDSTGFQVDQDKIKQQLGDAHEAVKPTLGHLGVELKLMFPNLQGSTPEQINHGLDRIYGLYSRGWEVVSSGQLNRVPGREPRIVNTDAQASDNFSRTTSKTC